MTDEEIKALAKQARQKYCDNYNEGIDLPTYHCEDNGCPLYRRMNHCGSAEYYVGVLDGFKAGFKKGEDSMSDYVMELSHAAYND